MDIRADIDVLREMVRLAENRREEELSSIERTNRYNLALIAFSGSFLSVLISTDQSHRLIKITGALLIAAIFCSLAALRPRVLKNGALTIDLDIQILRNNESIQIQNYLLEIAELTELAAESLGKLAHDKKFWTILSAIFLALSLVSSYVFVSYA